MNVSFFLIENGHSSCPLQEGQWPDQGERQTPGDGGAFYTSVQGLYLDSLNFSEVEGAMPLF